MRKLPQCPYCKAGFMPTTSSRRVGESQQRRIECKVCFRRVTIIVDRKNITPKSKPIPIEFLQDIGQEA